MRRPSRVRRRTRHAAALTWMALVALAIGATGFFPSGVGAQALRPNGPEVIDIQATTTLTFVPNTFTVAPGAAVEVVVTQLANFEHTFTLVNAVNATIPSSDTPAEMYAFIQSHGTLVNVSLGSTPGAKFYENFTAPTSPGAYEFLCEVHFPSMTGTMTDSASSPSSSSSGLSVLDYGLIGAVAGIVVIAGVLVAVRRRGRPKT